MALSDAMRLYDISTRLAVYVEGVKLAFVQDYNATLARVEYELRYILRNVDYDTLDGLSKAKLNVLILALKDAERRIYSEWTTKVLGELLSFMHTDVAVSNVVYATAAVEEDDDEEPEPLSEDDADELIEEPDDDTIVPFFPVSYVTSQPGKLWSAVKNTPLAANGVSLVPYIGTIGASAVTGTEALIRRAWVNKWSIAQTLAALGGDPGTGPDGGVSFMQRQRTSGSSVLRTGLAHVAGIVSLAVQSTLFRRYGWHSVMDGKTTHICISRNGKIYIYGQGPIPPAHTGCRSSIAPYVGNEGFAEETFFGWSRRQPADVQDDIFGADEADAIRAGRTKAKDVNKYEADRPLTLAEFRRRIRLILKR